MLQIAPFNTIEGRLQNSDEEVFTVTYGGLVLNTWQHLGLVYNGSTLAIVDCVEVASVPANGIITDASVPFYVGNVQFQFVPFLLNGRMDEVAPFTRALVADEMECLMASGPSITVQLGTVLPLRSLGTPGGDNTAISTLTDLTRQVNGKRKATPLPVPQATSCKACWGPPSRMCGNKYEIGALRFGDEVVNGPGRYAATFTSSSGCDSTVVLKLQGEVNTKVVRNRSFCSSLQEPGHVATGGLQQQQRSEFPVQQLQYFQTAVGNYAVIVTQGCSAMSDCRKAVPASGSTIRTFVSLSPASEALDVETATTWQTRRCYRDRYVGA